MPAMITCHNGWDESTFFTRNIMSSHAVRNRNIGNTPTLTYLGRNSKGFIGSKFELCTHPDDIQTPFFVDRYKEKEE